MRPASSKLLPVLACAVAVLGLSNGGQAQVVRDIPYFMRSPQERAATLKLCRDDHRYDRRPECANAATAEDRLWAMRQRAGTPEQPGGRAAPNLDTFQLSPTYWARTRLARRATLATCRLHPGMAYPAKVCAAAEQGELLDTGGRS